MPQIPETTVLTDRQLLVHVLEHVEEQAERITEMHRQIAVMYQVFTQFQPMINQIAPPGTRPDMLSVMQARRGRRGRGRGPAERTEEA